MQVREVLVKVFQVELEVRRKMGPITS
jgi:hypothetical protein